MRFEWDDNKNLINISKHGIGFETALKVFEDALRIEIYDELHSDFEDRYITIGSVSGKTFVLTVVYTTRANDTIIRLISARKATNAERRMYNDSNKIS